MRIENTTGTSKTGVEKQCFLSMLNYFIHEKSHTSEQNHRGTDSHSFLISYQSRMCGKGVGLGFFSEVEKWPFFDHFWANFGYVSHIPAIRF